MALEDRDRALLDAGRLDADDRHARAAEPLVEAGQEAGAVARLRLAGPHDDDAVDRLAQVALAHLDQLGLERVPERRRTAGGELAAEIAAEVPELVVADVAAELGLLAQRRLDGLQAQRQLERAHPGDPPVGVLLDLALDRVHGRVDRPEHEHGQILLVEPLVGQCGVRALDEVLGRLLAALEVVRVRIGGVDLLLAGRRSGR